MRARWMLIASAAAVLVAAAIGYSYFRRVHAQPAVAPPPPPDLLAGSDEVSIPGKIRARNVVDVPAPMAGMIGAFLVEVGQEVFEGQALARISSESLENERDMAMRGVENARERLNTIESAMLAARLEASRARAAASAARSEFDRLERIARRQQMLLREGATPKNAAEKAEQEHQLADQQFRGLEDVAQRAEARVEQLLKDMDAAKRVVDEREGELEEAQARVGASELLSPVAGLVVGRKGVAGEQVSLDTKDFFQIAVDLSQLEVTLEPEPPLLAFIKPGQAALVLAADQSSDGILAEVKSVENSLVAVPFVSPNPGIRPGMTAQVRIKVK